MPVLNIILVTRECGFCFCSFCNSVFVRKKKMTDVKTAAISSLIHQELDNYRPIILSDSLLLVIWQHEALHLYLTHAVGHVPQLFNFAVEPRCKQFSSMYRSSYWVFLIRFHVVKRFWYWMCNGSVWVIQFVCNEQEAISEQLDLTVKHCYSQDSFGDIWNISDFSDMFNSI